MKYKQNVPALGVLLGIAIPAFTLFVSLPKTGHAGTWFPFKERLTWLLPVSHPVDHPECRADDSDQPILPPDTVIPTPSTIPPNGDLNPYGIAFVPNDFPRAGALNPGDILVSNFNNSQNLQGTGTTIVTVPPDGHTRVFFQGQAPLGLTTGLAILKRGYVIVGNFPSADGTCETAQPGSLLVLDTFGNLVVNLTHPKLQGPWDLTVDDDGDRAAVFVSNALNGTVTRFDMAVGPHTVFINRATNVGGGYVHRCDPAAFVVSPTGLALDERREVLFVASTGDNEVFAIDNPETHKERTTPGRVIYQDPVHLHGPNGLAAGPCGHLFAGNADVINSDPNQPSEIVEFTTQGKFIRQYSVDPAQGGAFGVALMRIGDDFIRFAAVDDNQNILNVWTLPVPDCHDD